MLYLHLDAPFAVFRTFATGSFRPTAGFITPSAAYGLLLNIAGVEMRSGLDEETTGIEPGLPKCTIALGALSLPRESTLYQQLHNYPIGNTGGDHAPFTKGTKYNIGPVRRALLSDIRAYICVKTGDDLEMGITRGLEGNGPRSYGLPFLGDNNFLIDKLELVDSLQPALWFKRIEPEDQEATGEYVTRLSITVNREDQSKTTTALFAPTKEYLTEIPNSAWVEVVY